MSGTLVYDTETTGLPIGGTKYADHEETEKWEECRLVQIAWELYDG
jgi:hypothetical protein